MKIIFLIFGLLFQLNSACFSQSPQNALQNYVHSQDSSYTWQKEHVQKTPDGSFYEVNLVSQTWQNIVLKHRLTIYIPERARYSGTMVLVLKHIYNRNADMAGLKIISDSTHTSAAFLYDMPNQPLFGGREEDDLQAYTFSEYIRTGDESWPLLFPMVKSAVRAMDAIQELSLTENKKPIKAFVVAGHSKRGHATWLTAAADKRVKGIIPLAIDVLNATAQLPHHLQAFGQYNTPSAEATEFLHKLKHPRGKRLIEMIDPYTYREQLKLPKLIVSATNDDFFPTDALNLYWSGLKGPKWVLYLSNAGHVRADSDPRINPAAFAFVRAVAMDAMLPQFTWQFKDTKESLHLIIKTGSLVKRATAWVATSKTKDFRQSQWSPMEMRNDPREVSQPMQFKIEVPKPSAGFLTFYGEIEFVQDGHAFLLSTQTFQCSKATPGE